MKTESDLTDHEINAIIAGWLGWKKEQVRPGQWSDYDMWHAPKTSRYAGWLLWKDLPFVDDSRAINEVKAKLREQGQGNFAYHEVRWEPWEQQYYVKIGENPYFSARDPNENRAFCLAACEMIRGSK